MTFDIVALREMCLLDRTISPFLFNMLCASNLSQLFVFSLGYFIELEVFMRRPFASTDLDDLIEDPTY